MNLKYILILANNYNQMIKNSQVSIGLQAGDIADAFPEYFPKSGAPNSPLTNKLSAFVSSFLPEDVSMSVKFLVQAGFKPAFVVSFVKGGNLIVNNKWSSNILNFLSAAMKDFTNQANKRLAGKSVQQTLEIAKYNV